MTCWLAVHGRCESADSAGDPAVDLHAVPGEPRWRRRTAL